MTTASPWFSRACGTSGTDACPSPTGEGRSSRSEERGVNSHGAGVRRANKIKGVDWQPSVFGHPDRQRFFGALADLANGALDERLAGASGHHLTAIRLDVH